MARLPLISQRAEPLTASPRGEASLLYTYISCKLQNLRVNLWCHHRNLRPEIQKHPDFAQCHSSSACHQTFLFFDIYKHWKISHNTLIL